MTAPERTCVGCRRKRPATELVRVVAVEPDGLALGRSLPGRGAWVCPDGADCADRAARKGALGRALRRPVAPAALDWLREELAKRARMEDCGRKRL